MKFHVNLRTYFLCVLLLGAANPVFSQQIAYIHGDVAEDGATPSGSQDPYDQMLLTDSGNTGMSDFKDLVESQGYEITQHYDAQTTLDNAFLDQYDAIIFGLHQKVWSSLEKDSLDDWIRDGGNMMIYSDSASGGRFNIVGAQNPVGQTATNNLISRYGLEVTVDQANGIKAYRAGPGASHPIVQGRPIFEGEGVSPVAVDPTSNVQILIPYNNSSDHRVSGDATVNQLQNLTISNPSFAALALAPVGAGNVIATFDRQPMWNNGPGSDIEKRDNEEILRRIVNFMVEDADPNNGAIDVSASAELLIGEAGTASLDGTITGSADSVQWRKVSGPGEVSFGSTSAADTTATFSSPGEYELALSADNNSASDEASVNIQVVAESQIAVAVNAGSVAYRSNTGISYQDDAIFTGGHIDAFGGAVAGTTDDDLYNHARSKHSAYRVPLDNGDYTVLLQLSETFFTSANQRQFDVSIEGQQVIDNLDLFASAPGKNNALDRRFDVTVTDGVLDLEFSASINNALLNAFVVVENSTSDIDAISLPGRIEAEDYNLGGNGVGYFDTGAGNNGGAFRNDDVDIQAASEGGFSVGWIANGEWLAYTVDVQTSGSYTLRTRVASLRTDTKTFHIEIDGTDVTGPITFNTSGAGWQAWRDVVIDNVALNAGSQELRIVMDSSSFNINYVDIQAAP